MGLLNEKSAQFNVTDGRPFFIKVKEGRIEVFEGSVSEPYWTFQADTATYLTIFNGQVQTSMAIRSGKLSFLRLVPHEFAGYALLGAIVTMCQEQLGRGVQAST